MSNIEYHIEEVKRNAYDLSVKVREQNEIVLSPTSGSDLKLIPVYETEFNSSLLSLTNDIIDTKIIVAPCQPQYVNAYWKKYNNKNVVVLTEQNYCYSRFYACKELMHHYLYDTNEIITTSSINKSILEIVAGVRSTSLPSTASMIDVAAYWGALEYLLPKDVMPLIFELNKHLVNSHGNDRTIEYLATLMKVPAILLEYRLHDQSWV